MSAIPAKAQVNLLAIGAFTDSRAGYYKGLSGLHGDMENGVAANLLGGLGSGIAWASGNTFLAFPDRGPNAVSFNSLIDDTVTCIPRFHTLTVDLEPVTGGSPPFTLPPTLDKTTLLFSGPSRVYGNGAGLNVGTGVPPVNTPFEHYFSRGSDNFDPSRNSSDPKKRPHGLGRHSPLLVFGFTGSGLGGSKSRSPTVPTVAKRKLVIRKNECPS